MLIAIEGCVGSGTTTVARGLAQFRHAGLLLEDFSSVPFLEKFYVDPARYALETEFGFLLQHYHQLHFVGSENREIIADFALDKDLIFADLNMGDPAAKSVFIDLYRLLDTRVSKPDITILLTSSDRLVLERIKRRGRPFELATQPEYYCKLNAAYKSFFESRDEGLIRVSSDEMDFCANPELYGWLSAKVDQMKP
jgi:deoxyadenosine/deoxycytidine kinase